MSSWLFITFMDGVLREERVVFGGKGMQMVKNAAV